MARTADTAWLDGSIAALRGVGWGGKSRLHELTEAAQGKYHYTIGPYSDAVLSVKPGDRIRIETRDAFEGAIRTEQRQADRTIADAVRQSAERADHDRGRRTGRRAGGAYRKHAAARREPVRHLLHDPVFRRADRHHPDRDAERPAAGTDAQDPCRREQGALERRASRCPTARISAR